MDRAETRATVPPPDIQRAPADPWSPATRWLTAGLLLAATATAFETLAVATILPAMVADLGALDLYGWAFTAFLLANVLTVAVAGEEIDRVGPVWPFALGIALFAGGLLLAGLAPSMPVVIVARAAQGAGSGVLAAVATAMVGLAYTPEARPRMVALLSTAWVLPGLTGPAVAGLIAESVGWRWVFLGIAPLPIVAAAFVLPTAFRLARPKAQAPSWAAVGDAGLLTEGIVVFLVGLGHLPSPPALLLSIAGAWCVLAAFHRRLRSDALRDTPVLAAAFAVMGLLSIGFYGMEAYIPLLLTDLRGQSLVVGGLPLTASALTWAAVAWLLERRASRTSYRRLACVGLALIAAGIIGTAAALLPAVSPYLVLVAWTGAGLGVGLAYAAVQLVTLERARPDSVGTAISMLQLAHTAGITLATGVGGAVVATWSQNGQVKPEGLAVHAVLMLVAIAGAMAIAARIPAGTDRR